MNVLGKSWDRKKRDWTSEPLVKTVSPGMLLSTMCGCTDVSQSGFIASEATDKQSQQHQGISGGGGGFERLGSATEPTVVGSSGYFGEGSDVDKDLSGRVMRQQMGLGTLESGGEGSSTGNEGPTPVVVVTKEEKEERGVTKEWWFVVEAAEGEGVVVVGEEEGAVVFEKEEEKEEAEW